jgi:hypothetical protein
VITRLRALHPIRESKESVQEIGDVFHRRVEVGISEHVYNFRSENVARPGEFAMMQHRLIRRQPLPNVYFEDRAPNRGILLELERCCILEHVRLHKPGQTVFSDFIFKINNNAFW